MREPEFASVEAFIQYLMDDERGTYTVEELGKLNHRTRRTQAEIRDDLESKGFSLERREVPKPEPRGFTTSSNDRWFGPGSK